MQSCVFRRVPGPWVMREAPRWVSFLLLPGLVLLFGCSGSKGDGNTVSGKVKLGDKPVAGMVHFVYADAKELTAPISEADGSYTISKAPTGQVKILVKGQPGAGAGALKKPPGGEIPGGAPTSTAGVPPPAKYGVAATSDLTYDVKAGKQTHDINLSQ